MKKRENWEEKIKAYALKNAIEHEGKAIEGAVISALFHEGLKKSDVGKIIRKVKEEVSIVNKLSKQEQEKEFAKLKREVHHRKERKGLPLLPGAKKGKVIMRFRPAPSGPLHIGHIISNMSSSLYAKKYKGKFYVIIDDTNPETIVPESYKSLKQDCDWIFGNVAKYINASSRLPLYYQYIEKLLKKDKAYVCDCSKEEIKKNRKLGRECSCRQFSVSEHEKRWRMMLGKAKKNYGAGKAIVRFKGNMQDKNPALRDFSLARIILIKHPEQKKKFRVWPMMNLAVAVDDIEMKMTHIIRGKDHRDNAVRQEMIFNFFGKKYPWAFFIGRLKFTDLILSKRKIAELIEQGEFSGVEDERVPTIVSLRKRGYKKEAFEKLAEHWGLSEVDKVISSKDFFLLLDKFNK